MSAKRVWGDPDCRVYWGSHGCHLQRGHEGTCQCDCCDCADHPDDDSGCVAKAPYYGKNTRFYGEDVASRGLPGLDDRHNTEGEAAIAHAYAQRWWARDTPPLT